MTSDERVPSTSTALTPRSPATRWRTEPGLRAAREEIHATGWTVVRDLPFAAGGRADADTVVAIASAFGVPSGRDGGRHVWPVRPDARGQGGTFSSRTGAAGFHTDAQYHRVPEARVCLFVVRPALVGGLTRVLAARDAVAAIGSRADGRRLLRILAEPTWRWRVPREFVVCDGAVRDGVEHAEGPHSPVLPGDGTIRWRGDNVASGTPASSRAVVPVVEDCLDAAAGAQILDLAAGDLVVLDNKRVLHGRTWFDDARRLLLRVRLWSA
jgi:hypothetical protein